MRKVYRNVQYFFIVIFGIFLINLSSQASAKCDGGWPKCWKPEITIGSSGNRSKKTSSRPAPSTVLEPDPAHHFPGCHAPYRARNLTNRQINVVVLEHWKQSGPNCNITGDETPRHLILAPRATEHLGCSLTISSMSMCTDIRKWSIPKQRTRASTAAKKGRTRPADNGPRH